MNKNVVYTSIFGKYDNLIQQTLPDGWDYKCFDESNSLPLYSDNNRSAKRFKILPHRYLSEYTYSIFIDGNIKVIGNINELIDTYLQDANVAFFNHGNNTLDPRSCIYEEGEFILQSGHKHMKLTPERGKLNYKDDPNLIKRQLEKYKLLGYPRNNGLVTGMVILRKHNEPDCISAMEDWWTEIKYNSKRDQLSFNYIAWKHKLKFNYIDGDSRNNKYFVNIGKHIGKK